MQIAGKQVRLPVRIWKGCQVRGPAFKDHPLAICRKERAAREQVAEQEAAQSCDNDTGAQPEAKKKKVNPFKIRQKQEQIERLEGQIQSHETRIAVLTQLLSTEELYRDHQLFRTTMEEHDRLQAELNQYMEQWETLHSEMEALQN